MRIKIVANAPTRTEVFIDAPFISVETEVDHGALFIEVAAWNSKEEGEDGESDPTRCWYGQVHYYDLDPLYKVEPVEATEY